MQMAKQFAALFVHMFGLPYRQMQGAADRKNRSGRRVVAQGDWV
tara:strand:+ start:1496 stop:1627 length:132 start_codon:yes stop_codon:yes gene_type:complete